MPVLFSILIFIVILTFLVVIHELGHLITARLFGIKVEEFGVGFPPRVRTLFHWKGIPVTLNALPIGGFVRIEGENFEEDLPPSEEKELGVHNKGVPFYTKPAWQRIVVLLAGATTNFVFGILAFTILFSVYGIPNYHTLVTGVASGSPAEAMQILPKDRIASVQAKGQSSVEVKESTPFVEWVVAHKGETVTLTVVREGQTIQKELHVRTTSETPEGQGSLGLELTEDVELIHYPWYRMPFAATQMGITQSVDFGITILKELGKMVGGIFGGRVPADIAGPVGIVDQTVKQQVFSQGILPIINFAALFSINLAIMNVLPIPALDGGRVAFVFLEKFIGRKRQAHIEAVAHQIGFVFLMSLVVLITIHDIFRLFQG